MRHEAFDGVVIRARQTGDHDVLLTILTAEMGRISVLSKGSKSLKGEQRAISQLFTHANFEVYQKGDLYILKGGTPLHTFYQISDDVVSYSLASYLCSLAYELTDEGEAAGAMTRLLLNALYSISNRLHGEDTVKAAFELRAAILSGFTPDLSGCTVCGTDTAEELYLDVMNGSILCAACLRERSGKAKGVGTYDDIREAEVLQPITPSVLAAIRYVATAPLARLFSFEIKEEDELLAFVGCAERYVLSHLGHGFDTLDFYRVMRDNDTKGNKL